MTPVERLEAGIVLPVDKPLGWTSFQCVNKIKASIRNSLGLKKFKIGHAGTLDPLASGLLLVCIGKATKQIAQLQDGEKTYTGTFVLGATTPCFDLEQAINHRFPYNHITPQLLDTCRRQFIGLINQVPPMFSAVKINGTRAYEYARVDDPTVTTTPKQVQVKSFEITQIRPGTPVSIPQQPTDIEAPPTHQQPQNVPTSEKRKRNPRLYDHPEGSVPPELPQVDFEIVCSKGTYIRSLARDFGEALQSGAFLASLRRQRIGDHAVEQAIQLDQIENWLQQNLM
ncbi:MAG: tRNA pseudouridine(55) synthase TruB [Bacteroidales bacterium]|nr:tRNA pseudouridine(55) synthase TruB [Bacteroidales bacterium]